MRVNSRTVYAGLSPRGAPRSVRSDTLRKSVIRPTRRSIRIYLPSRSPRARRIPFDVASAPVYLRDLSLVGIDSLLARWLVPVFFFPLSRAGYLKECHFFDNQVPILVILIYRNLASAFLGARSLFAGSGLSILW